MRSAIAIRPFAEADSASVRELFIEVNRLLSPPELRHEFEKYIARSLSEEIDHIGAYYGSRQGGFWVAARCAAIVGMFGLERSGTDVMELRRMYVSPAARRSGIARCMLRFAEDECRRRGAKRLELSTSELQAAAIALYQREGYQLVKAATADEQSNKTLGGGIRRYHFEKELSGAPDAARTSRS